jgi:flavin reductase (DIM6/NTAB) family NADH-FMN oxidoreductase RutF
VASGATDAIVAADLGANVQYTNAAGCAITLNTMPAGFSCVVSAETAGVLSFVNGTAARETAIAASGATTAQYQTRTLFWRTATNVRIT